MGQLFITLLVVFFLKSSLGSQPCGVNEYLESCAKDCLYDNCPKNAQDDSVSCASPKECVSACKCIFNHRRADNGTCIQTTSCPPFDCPANEVFDPCPSFCPGEDCKSATPHGLCPFPMLLVVYCTPSCRCPRGHWRKNGVCVPYEECGI
ncbi:unnamed protein product [Leptidea sinapis]|uniref:TIL domain-containing protein n=1 Tax=Leptidea sinapis TaxID=189913 RepID=A0A5E4Q5B7_9NEOP|nr:unnamed protein product [Leptidea sinapis]